LTLFADSTVSIHTQAMRGTGLMAKVLSPFVSPLTK